MEKTWAHNDQYMYLPISHVRGIHEKELVEATVTLTHHSRKN